ncbi:hypothetical protein D3Z62_22865 [Lachnospiraceae bacterium]|nr:hypothetical protein [Lachnospiraceae bacterium]
MTSGPDIWLYTAAVYICRAFLSVNISVILSRNDGDIILLIACSTAILIFFMQIYFIQFRFF